MVTPLSRLLASALRDVVPELALRGVGHSFGEHAAGWTVGDGPEAAALGCSLHHWLRLAGGLLGGGVLAVHAGARAQQSGGCTLQLRIGGTGPLRHAQALADTLDGWRTADPWATDPLAQPRLQRAQGRCPATGAPVTLACLPLAGFLLTLQYTLRGARFEAAPAGPATAAAGPAPRAWLLHPDPACAAPVVAQAAACGWQATVMPAPDDALRRLRATPAQALPSLVVAFAAGGQHAGAQAAALVRLRRALPSRVETAAVVPLGSMWLADVDTLPGFTLRCPPLSREDWSDWTRRLDPRAPGAPAAPAAQRPVVVVAEADDVARCLVQGLAEADGYEVHSARDVGQALDACLRVAPAVLLFDPALPGAEPGALARRLRRLQRVALAPPCRLVAHTAAMDADTVRQGLEDGIDGLLPKPVAPRALRAELARWCGGRTPAAAQPPPLDDARMPSPEPRPAADGER